MSDLSGTAIAIGTSTSSPSGVPQFPLGLMVVFAMLVPAMLLLRKRASVMP